MAIFHYGENETSRLAVRDPKLGEAIELIGPIERKVDPNLFSSVMHHTIGEAEGLPSSEHAALAARENIFRTRTDTALLDTMFGLES